MSYNCTTNNIHFDKVILQEISKSTRKEVQFKNGIPLQLTLVFKVIMALPDGEPISSLQVRDYYHKFFGVVISTSSLSRMIADLKELRFIEGINNPHGSQKLSYVRLTMLGRKLQKLFIGTTSEWKDSPRLLVDRQYKQARQHNR